ncbi:hypothetical protein M2454_000021 [Aequitasia blattaphilus]|uniref:Uncharacterized protein n=1 Tax=Aequitasia blattaphilus TaxID=2949332 RepID=A0ABT1E4Q3_9FIRM|nr:hypothetical protein [Aequitasia blattaphilus]MCP1100815.1 hypothetical protein [Aequitasia blattaphilus]MCR8613455.1 hypothetical protein [Aequitasia blattaphilus]
MNKKMLTEEPYYEVSQMLASEIKGGKNPYPFRRFFYGVYEPQIKKVIYRAHDIETKEEIFFYEKEFAVQWCENGK